MKRENLKAGDFDLLSQYGLDGRCFENAFRLSFKRGEYLFREGDAFKYIYFVVSGRAKVCLSTSNGKRILLCYFLSNGIIGDIELMTDRRTAFSGMQAVTDFVSIVLPLAIYAEALKDNTEFIKHIGRELAEKLMQRGINGAITILQPLEARLCAYIMQTAINGVFCEALTETAELLGTSYRHLLRCLSKLCADSILKKEAYGYKILNSGELEEKAGDLFMLSSL